jgi:hypothetical protein
MINEFFRCHLHIGMCLSSPWHVSKLKFFRDNEAVTPYLEHGSYLFVLDGDPKRAKNIGLDVYSREQATPEIMVNKFLLSQPLNKKHGLNINGAAFQ